MKLKNKSNLFRVLISFIVLLFFINLTNNIVFSSQSRNQIKNRLKNILKNPKKTYMKKSDFIVYVSKAAKVNLSCTKGTNPSVFFKDINPKAAYAKAFLDAQFLGIIKAKDNIIKPNENVKYKEAKRIACAYIEVNFKNYNTNDFVKSLDKEFVRRFKTLNPERYITTDQGKLIGDMMRVVIMRAARKSGQSAGVKYIQNNQVKTITKRNGNTFIITLDWGEKHSTGYAIKILGYCYDKGLIIVSYSTKVPKNSDNNSRIVTHVRACLVMDAKGLPKNLTVLALEQR